MEKRVKIISVFAMIILCMVACKKSPQRKLEKYIWGTELVNMDTYAEVGEYRGINIPFAYSNGKAEIKFVSADGTNTDAVSVEVMDDTLEDFDRLEYGGYRFGCLGFMCKLLEDKDVTINQMIISINGESETIVFDNPLAIKSHVNENCFSENMTADAVFGATNNSLTYVVTTREKLTITDYGFSGAFSLKEGNTVVNGSKKNVRGTTVDADCKISLNVVTEVDEKNEYGFLSGNFYIEYINEEGKTDRYYFGLIQQGAGNDIDGSIVLKKLVDGK